ncbi:MAG TPA: VWA domain-containing protein [Terriglobales bacterium]
MRVHFELTLCLIVLSTGYLAAAQGGTRSPIRTPAGTRSRTSYGMATTQPPIISKAHHADEEHDVAFKSQTVLVQIPVVVTDKSGAHVQGLTKLDFEVQEDKKEQKIASFEEVQASHTPLDIPSRNTGEFRNLAGQDGSARGVVLVALDTVNTPFLDQAYGRKQLIKYLSDNLNAGQILGLVAITGKGLKVLHDFSSDSASLIEALNKVRGELPALQGVDIDAQALAAASDLSAPLEVGFGGMTSPADAVESFVLYGDAALVRIQQDRAIEITMRSFLNIARSLAGIPGRKSLIWATGSFPFYIDSPAAVPAAYLAPLYEEAMQALGDAQISVYPVDVRGLMNYSPAADANYRGSRFSTALAGRTWLQSASIDTLRELAEMTGGRAFYNSNDIAAGYKRAVQDSASYYLVGYYLDTKNAKPGWRKLKVKVDRAGAEVRARSGFFVTNTTMNPDANRKTDIDAALVSPFESTGVPVDIRWGQTTADGDKKKIEFFVHVPANGVTIEHGAKNTFGLEFVSVAVQNDKVADTISQTVEGEMRPEMMSQVQSGGLSYHNALKLPPGRYNVHFVVRDNLKGAVGSVNVPLTVN